jgi:hypothetical protein
MRRNDCAVSVVYIPKPVLVWYTLYGVFALLMNAKNYLKITNGHAELVC